jgi:CRISPR/Cas system-associated exonuclease Cas4 (RecB family)
MLPKNFQFSQSSLQDYVDCPRRFQLRYVEGQPWPAVQAEPLLEHERHMERGVRFHRLVERHQLGVDAVLLAASIDDPDLLVWWQAYLGYDDLHKLDGRRYPEFTLSAEIAGIRLQAKYDLLVVVPGERIVVIDWKTYRKTPSREWFLSRLQTRVYPYLVVRSGSCLFGGDLRADQVSMVYWVAGDPVIFGYSSAQFEVDQAYLSGLVLEVAGLDGDEWLLTLDESRCRFCEYRSLCGRGEVAGLVEEWLDVDFVELFSLGDVEEVGF